MKGKRISAWRRIAPPLMLAASMAVTVGGLAAVSSMAHVINAIERTLPAIPSPDKVAVSPVVLDRNGLLLRAYAVEDGRWRLPARTADVDRRFLDMLIGYEDRRFREHGGVDYRAMLRAAGQLAVFQRIVSGASTLTMQVARLIEARPTRSLHAKLRQILLARALERRLSKDDILNLYLALAPYGGNLEGIRAASLAYFGKEPGRLTVAQAALLVAIPQSPEARRPDRFPKAAKRARDRVLQRLARAGVIPAEQAAGATRERMPAKRRNFPIIAAHAADRAIQRKASVSRHRLTIDRTLQTALERLVADRLINRTSRLSAAILVANHTSGEVLASVGSAGLFETSRDGFVDMTRALRSPGSTLKPLIYGLAFEAGLAHPESLVEDRPTAFAGYDPVNFDGRFRGTVTVRDALTQSLNVPAVLVLDAVGPTRLMARLRRSGATPKLPKDGAPGLAIGLGGIGMSLHDLVSLYAAFANGGTAPPLHETAANSLSAGTLPVLEPLAAWYVSDILTDTSPPANGYPGKIAFKTGTSYGYRDAWAVGFDGRHVIGIWVGRPDGAPVPGLSGLETAAPLLMEAFDRLSPKRTPLPSAPSGAIEAASGALPGPLQRFRHPDANRTQTDTDPEIAFPREGLKVDLGFGGGARPSPLAIKIRNGVPPFVWFVNGTPIDRSHFSRSTSWMPDGPGFVTISVLDASGKSDRITVFVQ